jgi:asparagine synthase (glutamine-hydrolysing)
LATHISPESLTENQPIVFQDYVITADARLDNRDELCNKLDVSSAAQFTISDEKLILQAYQKWGLDTPCHLLGDFAFALWDSKEKYLFCARDYPGVRPFYYHAGPKHFTFASDIHGLLSLPDIFQEFDEVFLSAYLRYRLNFPDNERTFFKNIKKLPPAHAMVVNQENIRTWAFWEAKNSPQILFANPNEYVEKLADLFASSVACRIRSAYPVGAHISGGLDSSAIAVTAARILQDKGRNLTGGFCWSPQPTSKEQYLDDDERLLVNSIGKRENFPVHFSTISLQDKARFALSRHVTPMMQFIHEFDMRRQAEMQGIRTMLSGWGGDELIAFNGRGFFQEMLRRGRWRICCRELKARAELYESSLLGLIVNKLIFPWIPEEVIAALRPHSGSARRIARRKGFSLPTVLQNDLRVRLEKAEQLTRLTLNGRMKVRPYQLGLIKKGHLTYRIENWAAMGAMHGIQYAYPMLDRRIIEFALGLPPEMFMQNGWGRWLFRKSLQGILPNSVRWRKNKKDPALDAHHEYLREGQETQIKPLVHNVLLTWLKGSRKFHCLDPEQVREAIAIYQPSEDGPLTEHLLMAGVLIEQIVNPALAETIQAQVNGMA